MREISKQKAISAFDLDKTLVNDNSSYRFGCYLCRHRILPISALAYILSCTFRHSIGFLSIESLHEGAFSRLFRGRSELLIREWSRRFLDEHLEKMLYRPVLERLKSAQQSGHLTALLSSGPDFLVEEIAERLGVPVWHATQYAVDKDRQFCHISKLILGSNKARILEDMCVEYGIAKEQTYAYSDSHLDLPFLQSAGNAVGVNPTRQLRAECLKNCWPII